ncbi:TPA: tetratricopeptide repeat protein [Candidatus Poribacteria bacterium]|nr:tetratricopeptide repeat protein [Candidatus Poribacteria bacterium]
MNRLTKTNRKLKTSVNEMNSLRYINQSFYNVLELIFSDEKALNMNRLYPTVVIFILLGLICGCGEDSWTKKGKEFLAAGDYNSAIWYLQQAIDAKPTNAEAHYQLGLAYHHSGQNQAAIKSLRTAAKLAPERSEIQLALGEIYLEMGHRKLAETFFLNVLQESDSKDVLQKIARLTGNVYHTTRLTPDYVRAYGPSTSAGRVAFTAYVDDNNEIYVIDIDGKNKKRLTFNDTNDYSPCLSPDGTKIVYVSFMRWRNSNDEIHIMDVDGKNKKRLTFNVHSDGNPTFSADGKLIAFDSNRDGNSAIYIMDADGKNQRKLIFTGKTSSEDGSTADAENRSMGNLRYYAPSFSPDGSRIVFAGYYIEGSKGRNAEFGMRNSELRKARPLVFFASILPSFHPSISLQLSNNLGVETNSSNHAPSGYNVVSQIYVVDVDGKNLRQLTNVSAINSNPSFSTDGKKIVFDSNRNPRGDEFGESNSGIHIMDADGENQMRLTSDEYISMEPVFTPDGKKIVFTGQKTDSDNLGIYIMDLERPYTREELIKRLRGI